MQSTENSYSAVSKLLHWLMALMIFGLFGVGFWMVDLTYYSAWYKTAPHYHKSVGILLAVLLLVRLAVLFKKRKPAPLASHSKTVQRASKLTHRLLYLLLFLIVVTGYLISTADNRGIEVFNWLVVPGFGEFFDQQADRAGLLHQWLAYGLIALVVLHAMGALKHHFIDKDATLKRMWWSKTNNAPVSNDMTGSNNVTRSTDSTNSTEENS
ncbi:cytochrome b [Rheinheimera riviphila]|nr:cytochrome b [Rheinheimera riviphila]